MAKNVRISDDLYALAQWEARLQDRSIAQQLEHWAKRGIGAAGVIDATQAAMAMTQKLDALEVESGRRPADSLYFISPAVAKRSKPVFPSTYRKS